MVQGVEHFPDITPEERLEELTQVAQERVRQHSPQNSDPITRSYEKAFADLVDEERGDPTFRQFVLDTIALDTTMEPSLFRLKTHKTFQYLESPDFPDTVDDWKDRILTHLEDPSYQERFAGNIFLPVMSNISERGILLKAVAMLHGKTENVSILDTGCSLNEVLKRLALEKSNPLLSYKPVGVRLGQNWRESVADDRATIAFNGWLGGTALRLTDSIGMDIMPYEARDQQLVRRARSDSTYMGEANRDVLSLQSQILADADVPEVGFINEDVSLLDPESLGRKFDITSALTWLYQARRNPEYRDNKVRGSELRQSLDNMEAATKEDGLVVVQDFVQYFKRGRLPQFYPEHEWGVGCYSVWVKDMRNPLLGYQRYFIARSGRVEGVIPRPALVRAPLIEESGLLSVSGV